MAFSVQKKSLGSPCIVMKTVLILAIFFLLLVIVSGETLIRPLESQSCKKVRTVDKKGQAYFFLWSYNVINAQHIIQEWYLTEGNTTTMIASQNGENGVAIAASKLPDSLAGRFYLGPKSDGVLMIVTSYYSDTERLKFSSRVKARKTNSSSYITYDLKPICTVTVRGPPEFKSIPQNHISVAENSQLQVTARFDGNPQPTAELQWSQSDVNNSMAVKEQQERFMYNATYVLNPVSSSYCGKTLSIRAKNAVGRTADVTTYVDVVLSLDDPNLQAHKPNGSCVVVQWRKKDTGECNIIYIVDFKDIHAKTVYAFGGINIHKAMQCGIPYDVNITHVELTMGSKTKSKVFKVAVDESRLPPPTTKQPTTQQKQPDTTVKGITTSSSKTKTEKNAEAKSLKTSEATSNNSLALHLGYGFVVIIMASLIVLLVVREFRNKKNKGINLQNPTTEGASSEHPQAQINMHYMSLQAQERTREQYAKLSTAAYEVTDPEIKNKSPYVNFGNATYMTKNEM